VAAGTLPLTVAVSTLIVRPGRSGSNESYLRSLIEGVSSLSADVNFILFVTKENRALFAGLDSRFRLIEVAGAGLSRLARILLDQFVIGLYGRWLGADVVHFPGTVGSAFRWGPPQVVTVHYDLEPEHLPSIGRVKRWYVTCLMKRTCQVARLLAVPSDTFRASFVQRWRVTPERVRAVHHGVSVHRSEAAAQRPLLGERALAPGFILSVTNDLPHKNLSVLFDAYATLRSRGVTVPLVIVGDVSAQRVREWRQAAERRGLTVPADAVVLAGFLPHAEVMTLYGAAGVMATPTRAESSSMPVLEAMATGCPVVASDIPVHREIAGTAARLVAPTAAAFADAIGAVLATPQTRQQMIDAGLRVAAAFSWQRSAANMIKLYTEAAGRPYGVNGPNGMTGRV
jgi:glycosyltransferase involved in cell wall biosynthesis